MLALVPVVSLVLHNIIVWVCSLLLQWASKTFPEVGAAASALKATQDKLELQDRNNRQWHKMASRPQAEAQARQQSRAAAANECRVQKAVLLGNVSCLPCLLLCLGTHTTHTLKETH